MTQAPAANLPVELTPSGIEDLVVCVRLLISSTPLTVLAFPPGNRLGTNLLSDLLDARIELAGVRVLSRECGMELNKAMLIFQVSELGRALTAIKGALAALDLLPLAQIAWADLREGIMRVVHGGSAEFQFPSPEERATEAASVAEVENLLLKAIKAVRERPEGAAPGAPDMDGRPPT